jgi:hypothetical protein
MACTSHRKPSWEELDGAGEAAESEDIGGVLANRADANDAESTVYKCGCGYAYWLLLRAGPTAKITSRYRPTSPPPMCAACACHEFSSHVREPPYTGIRTRSGSRVMW